MTQSIAFIGVGNIIRLKKSLVHREPQKNAIIIMSNMVLPCWLTMIWL